MPKRQRLLVRSCLPFRRASSFFLSGTRATSGRTATVTPEFTEHPKVADAAWELRQNVFGEETATVAG